jgi:hypothetical protein
LINSTPVEIIGGLEYNAGCWVLRTVAHRIQTTQADSTTQFFVQLDLNGLSSIGTNPLTVLQRRIPGYAVGQLRQLIQLWLNGRCTDDFLFRSVLLAACLVGLAMAQTRTPGQPIAVDRIVAVVNDEVITQHELRSRLDSALGQLQRQGMSPPPRDVLEKQVLERLVMDKVQLQQARDMGLRIDDAQLEQALQRIAAGNNLSLAQFRAALEKDGIAFASFREEIRAEMTIARLREREVESKIFISDGEIDNYLAVRVGQGRAGEEYQLAHILLRAPESASPEQIQKLRAKAEQVLDRCARARILRNSRPPIRMLRTA